VILEGEVATIALDDRIADLYEAKYDYRPGGEGDWYSLRPRIAYAWREREFPRSVTCFSFPAAPPVDNSSRSRNRL
jgi:hypothetical protein